MRRAARADLRSDLRADPHVRSRVGWRLGALLACALVVACRAAYAPPRPPAGDAPPAGLRWPAEWEPNAGVIVSYPFALPDELLRALAEREGLLVLVERGDESRLARDLARSRVPRTRVALLRTRASARPYPRDLGPQVARSSDGSRVVIDAVCQGAPLFAHDAQRDRVDPWLGGRGAARGDDGVARDAARALGLPVLSAPLALTGGNLLSDGEGAVYFTDALVDENAPWHGIEGTLELVRRYTGARHLVHLPNVEQLGIQHADCWLQVLPGRRVLAKRVPESHPAHARIEAAVAELDRELARLGDGHRVSRIDCPVIGAPAHGDEPAVAAYTNALVTARAAYVPLHGVAGDEGALATWRAALPEHEVLGFVWRHWRGDDALHCRARTLPAPQSDASAGRGAGDRRSPPARRR